MKKTTIIFGLLLIATLAFSQEESKKGWFTRQLELQEQEAMREQAEVDSINAVNTARKDSIKLLKLVGSTPGDQLILYTKYENIAHTLTATYIAVVIGTTVYATTAEEPDLNLMIGLGAAAGVLWVTSWIFDVKATQHVGRAGLLLNENGIGIAVRLN